MKINILGGSSWSRRVTITSDTFVSSAFFNCDKKTGNEVFSSKIEKVLKVSPVITRFSNWPIPRLLRDFIFLWINGSWGTKIVLLYVSYIFVFPHSVFSTESIPSGVVYPLMWIVLIGFFVFLRIRVASWHGAEHMAIACYDKYQTSDVVSIAKESPIDKKCGGRFILPMILCILALHYLGKTHLWGVGSKIWMLILIETMLWVDHLIGFEKIPVFSQVSFFFQRYLTTKVPGERELKTASLALDKLIVAHQKIV